MFKKHFMDYCDEDELIDKSSLISCLLMLGIEKNEIDERFHLIADDQVKSIDDIYKCGFTEFLQLATGKPKN